MPSRRKEKRREDELSTDGWFRLSSDLWLETLEIPQKLRAVADTNFPIGLTERMGSRGIDVRTAQSLGLERLADEDLLRRVTADGRVLVTLDRDFWSDEKFPIHQCGGVIFVDAKDEGIARSDGFELLIVFLRSFGGGWTNLKIRASSERVFMKGISTETKAFVYEIRAIRGGIYARGIAGTEV